MKILAVTVCYHPDLAALRRQVDALIGDRPAFGDRPQDWGLSPKAGLSPIGAASILLVDNGSEEEKRAVMRQWCGADPRIRLSELGENLGIAAAHNHGIAQARAQGFSHVLLMDQDSLPAPDMVAQLAEAMTRLSIMDPYAAAVGPHYVDPVLGNPPDFVRIHALGIRRHEAQPNRPIVDVDYLISSGSLISLKALDAIGGMQEALFIDYVDIEWGLRARRLGWNLYGVFAAHMTHSLGPQVVRFLWRRFPLHSPQRHYFVVRNALWLYRDGGLPYSWRVPHGIRLVMRFLVYLAMGDSRRERLKYIGMGIRDGLAGRMGKPGWM